MKFILSILCVLLISGCIIIKQSTPVINVYGESDYVYMRLGLMWGTNLTNYVASLEEEDFLRGESGSDKGSKGRKGPSCSVDGGCSD